MKILFVTQAYPNASGAGWERRAAQHIRALARVGAVSVLLPWRAPIDVDVEAAKRCLALGATEVLTRTDPSMAEREGVAHAAARGPMRKWRALRRRSYMNTKVQSRHRARYCDTLADRFDIAFAFKIQSAIWLDSVRGARHLASPSVIDFDDIESGMFARVTQGETLSRFWRWKLRRQLGWLRSTERRLIGQWSAACLCSEVDAARMRGAHGGDIWVVPNGYAFAPPSDEKSAAPAWLMFVGTFGYGPNVDGVKWFAEQVWPEVRAELGENIELALAGFTPPPEIRALGERPGITVIADAPDLDPLYERANIVIAPLLAGSGTRIKLIEAAARGRAIVTTAIGCEGLDFVDGVHAEIADTPEAFAAAVVRLARDPARRAALAAAAYDHARARFDTERIEGELAERIRGLVGE